MATCRPSTIRADTCEDTQHYKRIYKQLSTNTVMCVVAGVCTDGARSTRCHTGVSGRRRVRCMDVDVVVANELESSFCAIPAYRYLQPTLARPAVMLHPAEPAALPSALQPSAARPSCVGAVTICVFFVSKTIV